MKACLPVLALAPFLLAACVPETPDQPATPPDVTEDSCGADRYAAMIGKTGETISVPAGQAYRTFKPGDPVTMDFNPTRLNFEHDKAGKLLRVTCG